MARVLSVEIGSSNIKIAEMDYPSRRPTIYKCIEIDTPEGAIKDGYIISDRMPDIKRAIRTGLSANKIRTKRILFTVFSTRIITREILLPNVKSSQINSVIESNISEYFPIELADYKISHFLLETFKEGENAGKHKVLVIACEKALINSYFKLAQDLGFTMMDLDYMGNSLMQAIKHNAGAQPVMAVKMESDYGIISILKQGKLAMQRNVNYSMGIGRKAEVALTPEQKLDMIVNTMERVMEFYTTANPGNVIEKVYVLGEGSKEFSNMDYISKSLQIPCRNVEYMKTVNLHKRLNEAVLSTHASVIGAGVGSIGLATDKAKIGTEVNYFNASMLMIGFYAVVALALFIMGFVPYTSALKEQELLKDKEIMYAPAKEVYDQYLGMQDLYAQVDYGNKLTQNSNDGVLKFLEELEEKMPSDMEMTEFSSDEEQCMMTVRVPDKETAAKMIDTLRGFESLMTVMVESITEEELDAQNGNVSVKEIVEEKQIFFTVVCTYYPQLLEEPVSASAAAAATTQEPVILE